MKPQAEMVEVIAEGERILKRFEQAIAGSGTLPYAEAREEWGRFLIDKGWLLLSAARQAERMRKALEDIAAHPGPHDDESAHWCADTARAALAKAGAT